METENGGQEFEFRYDNPYGNTLVDTSADGEEVLLYSELAAVRSEVLKVEVFPYRVIGYAYDNGARNTTQLSETTLPTEQEISNDPQFQPATISKDEFQKVWEKAVSA